MQNLKFFNHKFLPYKMFLWVLVFVLGGCTNKAEKPDGHFDLKVRNQLHLDEDIDEIRAGMGARFYNIEAYEGYETKGSEIDGELVARFSIPYRLNYAFPLAFSYAVDEQGPRRMIVSGGLSNIDTNIGWIFLDQDNELEIGADLYATMIHEYYFNENFLLATHLLTRAILGNGMITIGKRQFQGAATLFYQPAENVILSSGLGMMVERSFSGPPRAYLKLGASDFGMFEQPLIRLRFTGSWDLYLKSQFLFSLNRQGTLEDHRHIVGLSYIF